MVNQRSGFNKIMASAKYIPTKYRERGKREFRNSKSSYNEDASEESNKPADTDIRISKLTRTLTHFESKENFNQTCHLIEELLKLSENQKYVTRSFNCLAVTFTEIFRGLSGKVCINSRT